MPPSATVSLSRTCIHGFPLEPHGCAVPIRGSRERTLDCASVMIHPYDTEISIAVKSLISESAA